MSSRLVPAGPGRGDLREKGSRFLSFALPIVSAQQASAEIGRLRREYHDATHVAFAWILGSGDNARRRASDAGEPSGTAGKPIASAISAAKLTNVLVVVVRYFGGTKLGTGGLARAYSACAARALGAAGNRAEHDSVAVIVTCPYGSVGAIRRLIDPPEISLVEERFGAECQFRLAVRSSLMPGLIRALEDQRVSFRTETPKA